LWSSNSPSLVKSRKIRKQWDMVKKIGKYVMLLSSTQLYYDRFVTKIIFGKEYVDKLCFQSCLALSVQFQKTFNRYIL
jgi:hypothetical protein